MPVGVDDAIIIGAIGSAIAGLGSAFSGSKQAKAEKKKAKEMKRKTFADLLSQSMDRAHSGEQYNRKSQNELTGARAKALQDMAAGIRQSLVR